MIKLLNLFYSFSCFVYSICVVSLLALLPHSAGSLGGYPCSRSLSDPYYFQPRSFLCASGHCFWITHKHLNLQNWRIFSDESLHSLPWGIAPSSTYSFWLETRASPLPLPIPLPTTWNPSPKPVVYLVNVLWILFPVLIPTATTCFTSVTSLKWKSDHHILV